MDGNYGNSRSRSERVEEETQTEHSRAQNQPAPHSGLSLGEELERTLECLQRLRNAINRVTDFYPRGVRFPRASEAGQREERPDNLRGSGRFSRVSGQLEQRDSKWEVEGRTPTYVQLELELKWDGDE